MKRLALLVFVILINRGYSQELIDEIYSSYSLAVEASKKANKPILIYLGGNPSSFLAKAVENDTLATVLNKEFINAINCSRKEKRNLKKKYDARNSTVIILLQDESLYLKEKGGAPAWLLQKIRPLSHKTLGYFSKEYKEEFIRKDSTNIYEAIREAYSNSSSENVRNLTIAYLKGQASLLSPTNYQLLKTLMPTGDQELVSSFLEEMKPEMYTQEMAEKVGYELLLANNYSIDKTTQQLEEYQIPFQEEVKLYLGVTSANPFKDQTKSCLEFALEGSTHDFTTLKNCFTYVLRYGNEKEIEKLEIKYMFSLNDVSVTRSLLYADLLAELYLSRGDRRKFTIMQKRNEKLRLRMMASQN